MFGLKMHTETLIGLWIEWCRATVEVQQKIILEGWTWNLAGDRP